MRNKRKQRNKFIEKKKKWRKKLCINIKVVTGNKIGFARKLSM